MRFSVCVCVSHSAREFKSRKEVTVRITQYRERVRGSEGDCPLVGLPDQLAVGSILMEEDPIRIALLLHQRTGEETRK